MISDNTAIELFQQVRLAGRNGLLTDIDGTISRISHHPESATVDPEARAALEDLSRQLTLVGAVSGRSAEDARRMVGLDSLVYSGNHGMEIWRNGQLEQSPLAMRYSPDIEQLLQELRVPETIPGVFVENKGLTASIHYREAEDTGHAETLLLEEVGLHARRPGLRITRGQMVIEVRPPVELSKGTSVIELINEYDLNALVYVGDDLTDVDAFRALREQRTSSGGHFYGVGVASDSTPDVVRESADALVNGVDGVIELLQSCSV